MARRQLKIAAIGAASGFGRGTLAEILGSPEFNDLNCTLMLVDINAEALERMYRFALLLKKHFGSRVEVETTTDRRKALPGARYIITSVAVKRYPLWEQDFRVPLAYGFKHVLGENGGPGAIFHALRNYELMVPIAKDIEQLCPKALLLNYTNPESRIIMAVSKLTQVRSVGLCHGVMEAREGVSHILNMPLERLDIVTGGLNHFFWIIKVADRKTGKDLYPKLRDRVLNDPDCPNAPPLVRKMVEVFGCYTYPSDDHIGEYLSFACEFTGLKWHYGQECRPVPRVEQGPSEGHGIEPYVTGEKPIDDWAARKSGELAIPIILGIELDRGNWECAVNVPNAGLYIENMERDAIVEVPAVMDRRGVHPRKVGPLPEALAAFCNRQVTIQKLLVAAYAKRSRNLLLQTLLLDPIVDSVDRAEQMLDYMLELQKDYLPKFT
jgi:alpha-galactosidase